jgi:hypothetical protein
MVTPYVPCYMHTRYLPYYLALPATRTRGKEVVVKYSSGLQSEGTWYTDSNGKEMVK